VAGLLLALVIAAGAFALQMTLHRASHGERLVVAELKQLERLEATRAVIRIDGRQTISSVCQRVGHHEVVKLGGRTRLLIVGARFYRLAGPRETPLALAAKVDLAACPRLLSAELGNRLLQGRSVLLGPVTWHGLRAYAMRLGRDRPTVLLYVSRRDLRPLGLSFSSRGIVGSSRLVSTSIRPG
jgi:hypothetical protein